MILTGVVHLTKAPACDSTLITRSGATSSHKYAQAVKEAKKEPTQESSFLSFALERGSGALAGKLDDDSSFQPKDHAMKAFISRSASKHLCNQQLW